MSACDFANSFFLTTDAFHSGYTSLILIVSAKFTRSIQEFQKQIAITGICSVYLSQYHETVSHTK
jgi:hypothetical protein